MMAELSESVTESPEGWMETGREIIQPPEDKKLALKRKKSQQVDG